jgi:transcriptional regulator with XRE-family HTH domain
MSSKKKPSLSLARGRALAAQYKALADAIVRERKARHILQKELAKALRVKQPWLARLEKGHARIGVVPFLKIAKAVGFDPHKVIDELDLND